MTPATRATAATTETSAGTDAAVSSSTTARQRTAPRSATAPRDRWTRETATFASDDGAELFYRVWRGCRDDGRALVLFHGGHEHSGRFETLVRELGLEGFTVYAWDARGHGRSPGARGDASHFHRFVKDAEAFVAHLESVHGLRREDTVVLGHSVGSVIAATWLHDYAPPVRGAVLGSPAFEVKLYVPFALPALRLLERVRPGSAVKSYVRPGMLTHDREEAEARRHDPLISPRISVRVLTSLDDTARRVVEGAGSITTPVLLLSAGADWVVRRRPQERFFERLRSPRKRHIVLDGFYHEVFHESDRAPAVAATREFITALFVASSDAEYLPAAPACASDHPSEPLPALSPKRAWFAANRLVLKTAGRLSDGIRLGWRTGFDSGLSLDYVYKDRVGGITPLGRFADRRYLDTPGWRGVRERKESLEAILKQAIEDALRARGAAHVVDLASGPGLYLQEVLEELGDPRVSVLCRDLDEDALAAGRARARQRGLESIVYERGDASDSASIAALSPRPDIVVVSGLWELFADNEPIRRCLEGVRSAVSGGGSLIYTNQPHHPQLEYIARVLVNRDGEPWVMRVRGQSEIDALVGAAGFRKRAMRIDDEGIFSVSRAVRGAATRTEQVRA